MREEGGGRREEEGGGTREDGGGRWEEGGDDKLCVLHLSRTTQLKFTIKDQ